MPGPRAGEFATETAGAVDMSAPPWAALASESVPFARSGRAAAPRARAIGFEPGPAASDCDPLAPPAHPEVVAAGGFEEPHHCYVRPDWRPGVGALLALCVLLFVAAPIALLVALLHGPRRRRRQTAARCVAAKRPPPTSVVE